MIDTLGAKRPGNRVHLVPLRPVGTKPPLFCIHGGGGHVLDYLEMVDALPENQPVYGLKALDIGELDRFDSVDRLAKEYSVENLRKDI